MQCFFKTETMLTRFFLFSILCIFLFSCQKDPGSSANNNNSQPGSSVDSMRYTLRNEDSNTVILTSLYTFTREKVNGGDVVTKIHRSDTVMGLWSTYFVNYADKEYTYDDKGRLTNIFSKSRRRDSFTGDLSGTGSVENYNIYYSYGIPNDYGYPSTIDVDVYNDSTATTTVFHDKYITNPSFFEGYSGPDKIFYELVQYGDTVGFQDFQSVFWGGPYVGVGGPEGQYQWAFNKSGLVTDFFAYQIPWYFFDYEREDQRRVHYQYDTSIVKLMQNVIGKRTFKPVISADIVLNRYQHDLDYDGMQRGIVNQMKLLSLSSSDSTIKLDNKGNITNLVEKVNIQGSVFSDVQGRINKVVKQITKTRTEWPVGTSHYTQSFLFYYGK